MTMLGAPLRQSPARRSAGLIAVLAGLLVLLFPSTVFADPAGPTDYLSEIRSVEPPTPSIEVAVLGGDSFVQLIASPGTNVIVLGYQSEDYLWFQPDGTVLENQNAPSTYTNDGRYGGDAAPPNATRDAEPEWKQVASNGQYSWHDHRAHWMQTIRPAGKQVGDQIVEGVIPLVVDGDEVDVTVISTWQPEPSKVPMFAGAAAALGLVGFGAWRWRAGQKWAPLVAPLAAAAVLAGALQYTSLPSETGPRLVWILLPAIAVLGTVTAAVAEARGADFVARGALLVVGVQLAIWGLVKRDGLSAALIPTDAPGWFDRLATSGSLVGGIALAVFALWTLFGPRHVT
jgi:hypothetical protein